MSKKLLMEALESLNDITPIDDDNIEAAVELEADNPIDVINVTVPLFIRLLEWAFEHGAKDDMDLHRVAERLTKACQGGGPVGMEVYDRVVGSSNEEWEASIAVEKLDTITKKEDDDECTVMIKMTDKDNAKQLTEGLQKFAKIAKQGGDISLMIRHSNEMDECFSAHDLVIEDVVCTK